VNGYVEKSQADDVQSRVADLEHPTVVGVNTEGLERFLPDQPADFPRPRFHLW
jgi:hypothetical protein